MKTLKLLWAYNKVSKGEGTKNVEYAYNFWKCAGADYSKWSKLGVVETTVFETQCILIDLRYYTTI